MQTPKLEKNKLNFSTKLLTLTFSFFRRADAPNKRQKRLCWINSDVARTFKSFQFLDIQPLSIFFHWWTATAAGLVSSLQPRSFHRQLLTKQPSLFTPTQLTETWLICLNWNWSHIVVGVTAVCCSLLCRTRSQCLDWNNWNMGKTKIIHSGLIFFWRIWLHDAEVTP